MKPKWKWYIKKYINDLTDLVVDEGINHAIKDTLGNNELGVFDTLKA